MAVFRFFDQFLTTTTPLFLGSIINDGDNSFVLEDEGLRALEFRGRYFTKATGVRDGTITAISGGPIIEDENGDEVILIALSATSLSVDRSSFDSTLLSGDPARIMARLAEDDDQFFGSQLSDDLRGASGDDRMFGGLGDDTLIGGSGDDMVNGEDGDDFVSGSNGDDTLNGNAGMDTINGGNGEDRIIGGGGEDRLLGAGGDDFIKANGGADFVSAGGGDDTVVGARGADSIIGGAGDDVIRAGGGDDTIDGSGGDDTISGGAGEDVFVFNANSGDDRILDYVDNLDKLDIRGGVSFADLDIQNAGNDALISFGASSVRLVGVDATEIDEGDFLF